MRAALGPSPDDYPLKLGLHQSARMEQRLVQSPQMIQAVNEVQMLRELAACVLHEIDLRGRLRDADARLKQLEGSGNQPAPLM